MHGEMTMPINRLTRELNVSCLVKGAERYVLLYDDASCADALRQLGRWANNSDLSFSWYDAALMSKKIREARENCSG